MAYSTRQLCVRQFGDSAYRQASFVHMQHAIAFVAFTMFTKSYEVFTSVLSGGPGQGSLQQDTSQGFEERWEELELLEVMDDVPAVDMT